MLHKNVIEQTSGFRALDENELQVVSGGDILVTGDRPGDGGIFGGGGGSGGGDGHLGLGFYDHPTLGDGGGGGHHLLGLWFTLFSDTDSEDFDEYLAEEFNIDPDSVFTEVAQIGDDKYAIFWDDSGFGAIYLVTDNLLFDDGFTYRGDIQVTATTINQGLSAGISSSGGTLTGSNGSAVTFTITGRGG